MALWGVRDPGNVGAVLRSALAFGASSVALGPDTADPFGPKAVRASMGAIFQMPVARVASVAQLPSPRVALVAAAGEPLRGPLQGTLVIGAERAGLPRGGRGGLRGRGPHPDRGRLAQRGDGGHDRAVRVN